MKNPGIFLIISLFSILSYSQNQDCGCCSTQHNQFNFWVGDWEVFNTEGEKIGENLIEKLEDNCIISENWKGQKGSTGKSFNYYDPVDSTWNQLWISNTGNILKLKGTAAPGRMVLKSEITEGKKGKYYNQITWTKNLDGSVTQLWEIYDPEGNFLSNAFKGIYRKKN